MCSIICAICMTKHVIYNYIHPDLEDGLRHRVNIEIEHFRASIQEVLCDQFTTHRSQAGMGCMGTGCFQHTAALTKVSLHIIICSEQSRTTKIQTVYTALHIHRQLQNSSSMLDCLK